MTFRTLLLLVAVAASVPAYASNYGLPAGIADAGDPFIGRGFNALFACSAHFVAGRPLDDIVEVELADTAPLELPAPRIDERRRLVTVGDRIAAFRPGMGCTILPPDMDRGDVPHLPYVAHAPAPDVSRLAWPLGDRVALPEDGIAEGYDGLERVVTQAFDGDTYGEGTVTIGLMVLERGKPLAERYRAGFGIHTGYRTWSTAKTISAALIGIAVGRGLLHLDEPIPVPEWQQPGDPRQAITLRHLLNMESGLVSGGSNTNAIYFGGQDVISAATGNALEAAPGTRWKYANNDTLLMLRALRHVLDDDLDYLRLPHDALFEPLGMHHTVMETDHAGNFVGSSQVYTTVRDLARFALMLAAGGRANGEALLPEGWVDMMTTPAPSRAVSADEWGYGGQVWLLGHLDGVPEGTYTSAGNKGQYATVVPGADLVVVRTGVDPAGVRFAQDRLVADLVAALHPRR